MEGSAGGMSNLQAQEYWLTAWLIHRGMAALYFVAFLGTFNQFCPLLGEKGLLPVPRYLRGVPFRRVPSIFHWHYSDRFLRGVCLFAMLLSVMTLVGITDSTSVALSMGSWFVLWVLYLSIVNVGQAFYAFGWESLLLEAGFLAIFLGPSSVAPSILVIYLFRWLAFRVEFGAGLIKMRGDECWRNLTCLYYHHETQPMPNPLSWYFHNLPRGLHRIEVAGNHFAQLVVPIFLFAPQPVAGIAAAVIILTQLWLVLSGNFSWLNWVTIVIALSGLGGAWIHHIIGLNVVSPTTTPAWFLIASGVLLVLIAGLSLRPALNMISPNQMMNVSFDNLHLVNSYGAFGSVTRIRQEVVIEATEDPVITEQTGWKEYEFKGKPGALSRLPRQFAPYHLRLDWLMWFAALSHAYAGRWFEVMLRRLVESDPQLLKLLRVVPCEKPMYVRAKLYLYRFTTPEERRQSGDWWARDYVGTYMPAVRRGG